MMWGMNRCGDSRRRLSGEGEAEPHRHTLDDMLKASTAAVTFLNSSAPFLGRRLREKWALPQTLIFTSMLLLTACSPRNFLTRRLATDLILASAELKTPQRFVLQTGVVSSKDYPSPEYLVLQHRGWISANPAPCTPGLAPPPCSDILLTPSGVDAVRAALPAEQTGGSLLAIPVARHQLVSVTGVFKEGNSADVEFTWKWVPLNEIGAALYSGEVQYKSVVGFRDYDDGWRIVAGPPRSGQSIDDALKNAEPIP